MKGPPGTNSPAIRELCEFFPFTEAGGLSNLLAFDPRIVCDLDYYPDIVFVAFYRAGQLRALFGGGRYENLLETLGVP